MRVTTQIWVGAFLRREADRGAIATIVNIGAPEAGAIYIVENPLDGTFNLYGPAPQALIENNNHDRVFEPLLVGVDEQEVNGNLQKQKAFDQDIWVIETECRRGKPTIELRQEAAN